MPTTQTDEICTERVTFRCTKQMKQALDQAAKRDKRKLSQWIMARLQEVLELPDEKGIVSRNPLVLREVKTASRPLKKN